MDTQAPQSNGRSSQDSRETGTHHKAWEDSKVKTLAVHVAKGREKINHDILLEGGVTEKADSRE